MNAVFYILINTRMQKLSALHSRRRFRHRRCPPLCYKVGQVKEIRFGSDDRIKSQWAGRR